MRAVAGVALAAATLILSPCSSADPFFSPLPAGGVHVLFVGNSLTYTNELPETVAAIAASAGDTFRVASLAGPDLALIDHLNGATPVRAVIREGTWDYVVLQQGPTSTQIGRDSLILWTEMFDELLRAVDAVPALLMPWPPVDAQFRFDASRVSYQQAALSVGGVFLPGGEAWRAAWEQDASLPLYGPDGFHPSPMGTFLAALVVYERLSGRDARTLPAQAFASGRPLSLPESTILLLQQAAHTANERYPASGG